MMHATFISDELMQSMLIPSRARTENIRAASPGLDANRDPTIEIFATSLSITHRLATPESSQIRHKFLAPSRNSRSRMNVMRPCASVLAL